MKKNAVQFQEGFTWVNIMIGKVKRALNGIYHIVSEKHLPRYLAEFSYYFNQLFKLDNILAMPAYIAVRTPPIPLRLLTMSEQFG